VTRRRRMLPGRRHEERLFDDPHEYNLYPPAGIVKQEKATGERGGEGVAFMIYGLRFGKRRW